ncbi:hypothetical protein ACOSQ3_014518 [Xanthoceras sorbifolium]
MKIIFEENCIESKIFTIGFDNAVNNTAVVPQLIQLCRLVDFLSRIEFIFAAFPIVCVRQFVASCCFTDDFLAANLPPASSPFCSGFGLDLTVFSSGWKAPPAAVFKLNVDASCDVNATGIAVFAAAVPLKFCADVEVAEARAILVGIQIVAQRGLPPLLVETDSLNVYRLCNEDLLSRSNVENIIFDIQSLISSLNITSISFISRLGNGVAHGIAKRAFDLDVLCLWTCSFPVWLSKLFQVDVVSFSSPIGE